eukprot:4354453-Amphidinium_carterae.1
MPEVATTGSESAPLTKIRLRPRTVHIKGELERLQGEVRFLRRSLKQRKVYSFVALGAVQKDRRKGFCTGGRSLRFSCEREGFVKGPRSNGGFSPT